MSQLTLHGAIKLLSILQPKLFSMTRVTNIGRKRSFVEASFHYNEDEPLKEPNTQPDAEPYHQPDTEPDNPVGEEEKPPKKKRKRGKRPKSGDNKSGDKAVGEEVGTNPGCPVASEAGPSVTKKSKKLNSFKGMIRPVHLEADGLRVSMS